MELILFGFVGILREVCLGSGTLSLKILVLDMSITAYHLQVLMGLPFFIRAGGYEDFSENLKITNLPKNNLYKIFAPPKFFEKKNQKFI